MQTRRSCWRRYVRHWSSGRRAVRNSLSRRSRRPATHTGSGLQTLGHSGTIPQAQPSQAALPASLVQRRESEDATCEVLPRRQWGSVITEPASDRWHSELTCVCRLDALALRGAIGWHGAALMQDVSVALLMRGDEPRARRRGPARVVAVLLIRGGRTAPEAPVLRTGGVPLVPVGFHRPACRACAGLKFPLERGQRVDTLRGRGLVPSVPWFRRG